jgi:hypothetical protein
MPAAPTYTDGSYATAFAVSLPVFDAPFKEHGVNVDYTLTQEWCQALASYSPLALDTAHPDYSDFKLSMESEKRDLGAGIVQWTRTYAKLPFAYSRPGGNYAFTFPQIIATTQVGPNSYGSSQRLAFSRSVRAKLTRDFYRTADPLADIPVVTQFRIYLTGYPNLDWPFVSDANSFSGVTVPSYTTYAGYITADAASAVSYSLCAEASRVTQWLGNIYIRETLYVKAI